MLRLGAILLALSATLATSAVAEARVPTLLTGHTVHDFAVRPASVSYTGDGTGILGGADGSGVSHPGHLHWTQWTNQAARATGRVWLNDCRPSCAGGHFQARPATVTAGDPAGGHFRTMVLTYSLGGHRTVDHRVLQRAGNGWQWGIGR